MPPAPLPSAIIHACATLPGTYAALLGAGGCCDLLLTDPPFLLLTRRRPLGDLRDPKPRARKNDAPGVRRFETTAAYAAFSRAWLAQALPRVRPRGAAVIFTNALGRAPLVAAAAAHGFSLRAAVPWAKLPGARADAAAETLLRVYEWALVLSRAPPPPPQPPPGAGPSLASGALAIVSGFHDAPGAPHAHPHAKPFAALAPLLREFSQPGGVVLDPFCGSGAVPAAAVALGRVGVGCELDPAAAADAQRALSAAQLLLMRALR
jgi:site-specific DNA-methyltransferase (adenine-specific)